MCKIQILIWFADSLVNKVITKIPFRGFLGEKTVKQQVEAFFGTFGAPNIKIDLKNGLPVQKLRENYPLNFFLGPIYSYINIALMIAQVL